MSESENKLSLVDSLPSKIQELLGQVKRPLKGIQDNRSAPPIELTRRQIAQTAHDFLEEGMSPEEVAVLLPQLYRRAFSLKGKTTPKGK